MRLAALRGSIGLGLAVSLLGGCASWAARDAFSAEYHCPGSQVTVTIGRFGYGGHEVAGCGFTVQYTCRALGELDPACPRALSGGLCCTPDTRDLTTRSSAYPGLDAPWWASLRDGAAATLVKEYSCPDERVFVRERERPDPYPAPPPEHSAIFGATGCGHDMSIRCVVAACDQGPEHKSCPPAVCSPKSP